MIMTSTIFVLFINIVRVIYIEIEKNISEPLWISVKYSFTLPDDGLHIIQNMSEWSLILCILKFLYNVDFNLQVLYNQVHLVG